MGPWGKYGHTRMIAQIYRYNDINRRNDTERTFQRRNRPNRYRNFNCDVGDEADGPHGNQDYCKEESGNVDYHGVAHRPIVIARKR